MTMLFSLELSAQIKYYYDTYLWNELLDIRAATRCLKKLNWATEYFLLVQFE